MNFKKKKAQNNVLNSEEKLELDQYSLVLDQNLDWETREQYIDLLKKLISEEIDFFKFYLEFKERSRLTDEVFDSLKANFLPLSQHEKAKKFCDFICDIMGVCTSYTESFESVLSVEDENKDYLEFRNSMQEIYLEIQNLLN